MSMWIRQLCKKVHTYIHTYILEPKVLEFVGCVTHKCVRLRNAGCHQPGVVWEPTFPVYRGVPVLQRSTLAGVGSGAASTNLHGIVDFADVVGNERNDVGRSLGAQFGHVDRFAGDCGD